MSKGLEGLFFFFLDEPPELRELRIEQYAPKRRSGALWTFYMEGGVSRYLPVAGNYGALRFQLPERVGLLRQPRIHRVESVKQSVFSFQFEDLEFNETFAVRGEAMSNLALSSVSNSEGEVVHPNTLMELSLRQEDREYLRALNEEIMGGRESTAAEYESEVRAHLWQRFSYSLQPDGQVRGADEPAVDPVVNWLREGTQGHCELFASSFVLLARDAGFPARLVVGFAGGAWNTVEDYFMIRNRDAHAWAEIYDRSKREWIRVDPTPQSSARLVRPLFRAAVLILKQAGVLGQIVCGFNGIGAWSTLSKKIRWRWL